MPCYQVESPEICTLWRRAVRVLNMSVENAASI